MISVELTNSEPARLDVTLAGILPYSRSQLQKAILAKAILVDAVPATRNTSVSIKNVVSYDPNYFIVGEIPQGTMPVLSIIFENADIIVVNKAAGVLSHPAPGSHEFTLADALKVYCPTMEHAGDDAARAGLAHRLDRDASGIVVSGKTRDAFLFLKKQFAERLTTKHYTVLVLGNIVEDHGTINFPIARSTTLGRMAARPNSQEGKEAITHFDVIERLGGHATLLDVVIETGRTHQIRAHFFALQHPVVGDKLYIQKGQKQIDLGRLFLHARELTIELPSGETQTFTAPLPAELEAILEKMRASGRKH
jgi:23S rRNA pseudouridine1911/1915/1917 synthase